MEMQIVSLFTLDRRAVTKKLKTPKKLFDPIQAIPYKYLSFYSLMITIISN